MLVSLIIPIYKVERYISGCLMSVMAQTYDEFECILVDDKTPDNSILIASQMIVEYHGNIRFHILHHDFNKGLPNARNTGIKYATGDYVLFLDSDDTLTQDCIETMVGLIEQYPNVDFVQCGINDVRNWYDMAKLPSYCEGCHNIFALLLAKSIPLMVHGKLIRKKFLINSNLLFDKDILIHEDFTWTYFICQNASSFVSSQKIVYNYNMDNVDSIMHQSDRNFERSAYYYIRIFNQLLSHIDKMNYTNNRMFLVNYFFYVAERIDKIDIINPETAMAYRKLKRKIMKEAWRKGNLFEVLYLSHLYKPLSHLLNIIQYRRKVMHKIEGLVYWHYQRLLCYN